MTHKFVQILKSSVERQQELCVHIPHIQHDTFSVAPKEEHGLRICKCGITWRSLYMFSKCCIKNLHSPCCSFIIEKISCESKLTLCTLAVFSSIYVWERQSSLDISCFRVTRRSITVFTKPRYLSLNETRLREMKLKTCEFTCISILLPHCPMKRMYRTVNKEDKTMSCVGSFCLQESFGEIFLHTLKFKIKTKLKHHMPPSRNSEWCNRTSNSSWSTSSGCFTLRLSKLTSVR